MQFPVLSHRRDDRQEGITLQIGDGLIRHFIKNYTDTEDPEVRTACGTLAGVTDILCNLFLFTVKFIVGLVMASTAVTADAFNNLSDSFSSVVSLIGVRMAARPADQEHPFGHGRIEYAASFIVAVVILSVGIEFFRTSVERIAHPEPLAFSMTAFILLLLSVLVKLWMYFFNRNIGRRTGNSLMEATAMDAIFDVLTTAVTIISIIIYVTAHINVDGITGLIVSAVVIYAGVGIARDTLNLLIGVPADQELRDRICGMVTEVPGVISVHDLVVHNYGPGRYMATIHAEVSRRMTLDEAHAIADKAEKIVLNSLNVELVVHIDPVDIHSRYVKDIREKITGILSELDPDLSFHDLHVRREKKETDITFDLVVPYAYTTEKENETAHRIMERMHETNPEWKCVITIDRGMLQDRNFRG